MKMKNLTAPDVKRVFENQIEKDLRIRLHSAERVTPNKEVYLTFKQKLESEDKLLTNYYPPRWRIDRLEQEVKKQFEVKNQHATDSRIMFGAGSERLLRLAFDTYVSPGGTVAVLAAPRYPMYSILAESHGANVVEFSTLEKNENEGHMEPEYVHHFDLDALKEIEDLQMIVVTNPTSPHSHSIPVLVLQELENIAFAVGVPLLIDEAYIQFSESETKFCDYSLTNVLVLRTMSKAFGSAGMRIGMLSCHNDRYYELQAHSDSHPLDILQILWMESLLDTYSLQNIERYIYEVVDQKREIYAILKNDGFEVYGGEANWLHVVVDYNKRLGDWFILREEEHSVFGDKKYRICIPTDTVRFKDVIRPQQLRKTPL